MARKRTFTKKQKKTIGRGFGAVFGMVAGAEATKGTRYEGLGVIAGGYAGYKIGGAMAGNPRPKKDGSGMGRRLNRGRNDCKVTRTTGLGRLIPKMPKARKKTFFGLKF